MRCSYVDEYIGKVRECGNKEMLQACDLVESKVYADGVFIDTAQTETAIELIERYFKIELFDWEIFVLALVHCYNADGSLVFNEFLIIIGRGNGKTGFISALVWYLTTKAHGIKGYNVDIIANSEEQAKTSFNDVYEMLEDTWTKSKRFFKKTKELIINTDTKSYIKFNTSNAKTKDGKRSACLVFDELHEYENSSIIEVFTSGFGKRKHSRIFKITTNGYVRDGVLDEDLRIAKDVLNGEIKNSRLCPLIYKLDSDDEAKDPTKWIKSNPSLEYLPELRLAIEEETMKAEYDERVKRALMTKRHNLPKVDVDSAVTEYANIQATNRPLPDMKGWACTVGIDYAQLNDWAAVNFHFRRGDERFDINHAWVCLRSPELHRIKAPFQEWAEKGQITLVDDVSIHPDLIADYIAQMGKIYAIKMLALDSFRYALLANSLKKIGFDANDKTRVKLIRPSDIMQVEPIIQECFNRKLFTWGDTPYLRWAVNNTKRIRSSRNIGSDTGNFIYGKIEAKSRKTDPFMALVASMCVEPALGNGITAQKPPIGAIVF